MLTQADIDWIVLDSVDSTNTHLSRALAAGDRTGVVAVLAHEQTHGRGRAGRAWSASPGASLCLSIGLPLAGAALPYLPLCVGVAVAECLQSLGVAVQLKWPNDVLINGCKLGGILCESGTGPSGPYTVIGLGLNIRALDVPATSSGLPPTSLEALWLSEKPLPTALELAQRFVPGIVSAVEVGVSSGLKPIADLFAKRDAFLGKAVCLTDGERFLLQGTAMGLDHQGAYLVDTENGLVPVHVGDLSLRVQHA